MVKIWLTIGPASCTARDFERGAAPWQDSAPESNQHLDEAVDESIQWHGEQTSQ